MKQIGYVLFFLCLPLAGYADHIIGGELTMQSLGKPGSYRIQLNQYLDANATSPGISGNLKDRETIYIFSKKGPTLIASYSLAGQPLKDIIYKNVACAKSKSIRTYNAAYTADVQLDISQYSDPAGYYAVLERCCRNRAISNLASSGGIGMVFYLEFPALTRNGVPFVNSSPAFAPLNGNFICLNKLFTTTYAATDADGDQLRYSLVTPYQGYTDENITTGDATPHAIYPLVTWGVGYSAGNAIPGSPGLQIDANTGQMSVTAAQTGYFLFTVQCDEYRNGVKIGSVRRDFQIPVVDCPNETPPTPIVTDKGIATHAAEICEGSSLTLAADNDPKWAYQWQRDGINLITGNGASLTVSASGVYTVVKSFATKCSADIVSSGVQVTVLPSPSAKIKLQRPDGSEVSVPFCEGDQILASASGVAGNSTVRWATTSSALQVSNGVARITKSGLYSLTVVDNATNCAATDNLQIDLRPAPMATLTASATQICAGDSVRLATTNNPTYTYLWEPVTPKKQAELWVKQAGIYRVRITNADGCSAVSPDLTLAVSTRLNVAVDSISPLCASNARLTLGGTPTTGTWIGPGVAGNTFDPAAAGVGLRKLQYTVKNEAGCGSSATSWVQVLPPLQLLGSLTYRVPRGSSVQLQQQPNQPATLRWSPPSYLDQPDTPTPTFQSGESTTYTVEAQTASGCRVSSRIAVDVYDRLYIPTAFSPNGDGDNEQWRPINGERFPNCEVAVYDRWGNLIYQGSGTNAAWDGRYGQTVVEPGVYTYLVKTAPNEPSLSGKVTVLR